VTATYQASLSLTISQSLFKLMSIDSVMPSNHLILCRPLLLLPSVFPSIRVFSSELAFHIRGPQVCAFGNQSQRTDALELWCWRRLLRVPWTARGSNQSILKEINHEYSLEKLKLKLQYFGHLMPRTESLENTLMLGKIEGKRRRG